MRHLTFRRRLATLLPLVLLATACSSTPEATAVEVDLQEFAVVPAVSSVPPGTVTFLVTNNGPDEIHEFVIVRTDLDPGALPTDETGAVVEDGEGVEVVEALEEIPVDQTRDVTVDLEAGRYVLLCNIFTADGNESHYAMGMRAAFTVEG